MIYEFRLPDIGEGVVEGEVVRWLVREGDPLRMDQPMVEIMTDKATVEIPAPRAGRVGKRMFAEGQLCPVGKVLITIELAEGADAERGEKAAAKVLPSALAAGTGTRTAAGPATSVAPPASRGTTPLSPAARARALGPALATPATRKLARDLGVDLRGVFGTGPAARITSDDVRNHAGGGRGAAAATPPPISIAREPGDVAIPFRGLRRRIAENMARSKHAAAHFLYVEEVDCTDLVALRAQVNARLAKDPPAMGVRKLTFLPFIVKATAQALRAFPQLNAALDEAAGEIVQRKHVHMGLATATPAGLVVPVVRDANALSVADLAKEIDRLAEATRSGKATREDLSGSTFTITSLGQLGGVLAAPIINHPEVAILGVHKIAKRPAVRDDAIVIRDLMNLSISVDHRVVDGYDAARFVAAIKEALEAPAGLWPEQQPRKA
ncbi:MAG TPA: dihydrolipoamide acetyltransferase family protein [Polyangia bacterium]|jgi:pyruvate dehydrogenase E2 component (dihydrolipoamide acetyltransferase)|nr:dihydrolipoamide acetyltransferase family protein [Polyangia bacterium]